MVTWSSPSARTAHPGVAITDDFGCQTDVDETAAAAIFTDPSGHYVNVHSETYPDGAVRGQLEAS